MTALVPVEFHGATLYAIDINGVHHVALKPISDALGLDWSAQFRRIKRHAVLAEAVAVMAIPSDGGEQSTIALPLDKLNGWLFGVSVNRVKPELRDKLIQYQRECFDVLARHFLPATPYTVQPSDTLTEPQQIALRALLESNVKRLPHDKQAGAMVKGWSKLKAHFGVPYRQIPASEFTEAISIVARHVAEWELVEDSTKAGNQQASPRYDDAVRTQAAFDAASQAAAKVQSAVFNAVMTGNDEWKHSRYLLAFIDDSEKGSPAHARAIEQGAFVTTWPRLVRDVGTGECMCTTAELLDMAYACMQRLAQRGATAKLAA